MQIASLVSANSNAISHSRTHSCTVYDRESVGRACMRLCCCRINGDYVLFGFITATGQGSYCWWLSGWLLSTCTVSSVPNSTISQLYLLGTLLGSVCHTSSHIRSLYLST